MNSFTLCGNELYIFPFSHFLPIFLVLAANVHCSPTQPKILYKIHACYCQQHEKGKGFAMCEAGKAGLAVKEQC